MRSINLNNNEFYYYLLCKSEVFLQKKWRFGAGEWKEENKKGHLEEDREALSVEI